MCQYSVRRELCYDEGVQRPDLEPGLLQVFRFYAWLRLVSFFFVPFLFLLQHGARIHYSTGLMLPVVFIFVKTLLLMGYLYWPWLEHVLGRTYIPIGLIFATIELIIEQYLFFNRELFWQGLPFTYILLILVAWQYSYQVVIVYTLGFTLLEAGLNFFFPLTIVFINAFSETGQMLAYGLLFSRSIIFLLIGYVVNRLVKAQRQQRQALAEANQKLVSHAAALEQLATSRERVRLSRELHDTLAHTLSALAVQLDAILTVWDGIPARAQDMLEQTLVTTRSGLDETRRILSALRASPLEEMGLSVAVRTLVEDFAARNDLSLELNTPDNLDDLNSEVEQCYYRVTQEALENVAKHANAKKLKVVMELKSGVLELTIFDDGSGFNLDEMPDDQSLGIKGMRERAELIGANLSIESQVGKGTIIHLLSEQGV
jgi:signal transduction histidine kinase